VEDGSLSLDRVPTDLRDAVRVAADEVSHAAHKGRVTLRLNLPDEPVLLQGDPSYLERLVLNLVSNAVKFTPAEGCVEVGLTASRGTAELTVKDTGMGIPLEEQGRLFQRFFRSSLATENAIQGTGLGLHIVRSIAEAHQGSVDFESTPGVGTTFRFTVPLAMSASQEQDQEQAQAEETDLQPDPEPAGRRALPDYSER
jgi:signal transduction histidine kinase